MQILKISPKGQITIPKEYRKNFPGMNLAITQMGTSLMLQPVKVSVFDDSTIGFEQASESALDFWKSDNDDVYAEYYLKNKKL